MDQAALGACSLLGGVRLDERVDCSNSFASRYQIAVHVRVEHFRMDVAFAADRRRVAQPRSTFSIAERRLRFAWAALSKLSNSLRAIAANTVPAHVRKSFAMRTSSSTNVGEAKDSDKGQHAAIEGYAKAAGYVIVDWFYDAAVRGLDAVALRPGFAAMLERIAGNYVRTIIVESPDRFARDLAVQLAGHAPLRASALR